MMDILLWVIPTPSCSFRNLMGAPCSRYFTASDELDEMNIAYSPR